MVDIQSATAEIRRGKEKRRKKEEQNDRMKIYMACPITQGGHKQVIRILLNGVDITLALI